MHVANHEITTPIKNPNALMFKLTKTPSGKIGRKASVNTIRKPNNRPPDATNSVDFSII